LRHGIQVIGEKVGIGIEGHGGRRVTEHSLHQLRIRAGRDGKARGSVTQVVRSDPGEGRVELLALLDGIPEPTLAALDAGEENVTGAEDELVACLAGAPVALISKSFSFAHVTADHVDFRPHFQSQVFAGTKSPGATPARNTRIDSIGDWSLPL